MISNNKNQVFLDHLVQKLVSKKYVFGAVFHVSKPDINLSLTSAAGNIHQDTPYYIASINKTIITALILRLAEKDPAFFGQKISAFLPAGQWQNLSVVKGEDLSSEISIWNLLTHTSGLPCYLSDKASGDLPYMKEILRGSDVEWPFERVLERVKQLHTKFKPGQQGKAYYSNSNFRILARVLECKMKKPIKEILDELFTELNMAHTAVFHMQDGMLPIFVNDASILPAKYFSSTGYDIYSTAADQMIFLRKFFAGYFYEKEKLEKLQYWNKIFFPLQYGTGLQKFTLPRILTPFRSLPMMIGHAGSSGSFAFYIPGKDLFLTGTINQPKRIRTAFQAIIKIVNRF